MHLEELLKKSPELHLDREGRIASHQASNEVLRFIDAYVNESSSTLETGGGLSTILFTMKGARHVCIVPDPEQIARIREFCERHGISTGGLTFIPEMSEVAVPALKDVELDLILIDGRHGFPAPFIDWYYTVTKLKNGGCVIVDDTQLWTGDVLKKFLLQEPEWKLEKDFPRSAVFKKIADYDPSREWTEQPFVVRKSKILQSRARLKSGMALLRDGKLAEAGRKLLNALTGKR